MRTVDLERLQCRSQWTKTYPEGRRCYVCGMVLSRYNSEATCYAHRPEPDLYYCGHRFKLCAVCGAVIDNRSSGQRSAVSCEGCRERGTG